jgi:phosphatidate cytidylyltransferase
MPAGTGALAGADAAGDKRSDLPVRVASAAVMVGVAGGAFWLGGWVLRGLFIAVGLGVFGEWIALVLAFEKRLFGRALWIVIGLVYVATACAEAIALQTTPAELLWLVGGVIAVDVGAYFAGRTFGGPKIARSISPSKTWSGLCGGIVAVAALFATKVWLADHALDPAKQRMAALEGTGLWFDIQMALLAGLLVAVIAQSGDFFQSWMKRRAGVKDSGRLIPGHGGLFDRADGLIAVLFVLGLIRAFAAIVVA